MSEGPARSHQVALGDLESVRACSTGSSRARSIPHHRSCCGDAHRPALRSQVTPEQWRNTMDWDVNGFFHVVHAALPHLRESKGSIVFVSSAGLKRFPPGRRAFGCPKGSDRGAHAGHRTRGRASWVRANNVAVGVVDAGMFPKLVEPASSPRVGSSGDPEHTAAAIWEARRGGRRRRILGFHARSIHHRSDLVCGRRLHVVVLELAE